MIRNRKGDVSVTTWIILMLVSGLVIFSITKFFINSVDSDQQLAICQLNIVGANKFKNTDSNFAWQMVKDTSAGAALRSPLCMTQHKIIDLSLENEKELNDKVGQQIGMMIEKCWQTFGQGDIVNTFGQATGNTEKDRNNYYFSCYQFKIIMPKNSDSVATTDLLLPPDGVLWRYNVKGKKLYDAGENEFELNREKFFETGDKSYLPYAGYIFWSGNGYLEFANEISSDTVFDTSFDYKDVIRTTWEVGTSGIIGTTFNRFYSEMPGTGVALDKIESDQFYEVRYYSPYYEDPEKKIGVSVNSIKIVPLGETSSTASKIGGLNG